MYIVFYNSETSILDFTMRELIFFYRRKENLSNYETYPKSGAFNSFGACRSSLIGKYINYVLTLQQPSVKWQSQTYNFLTDDMELW